MCLHISGGWPDCSSSAETLSSLETRGRAGLREYLGLSSFFSWGGGGWRGMCLISFNVYPFNMPLFKFPGIPIKLNPGVNPSAMAMVPDLGTVNLHIMQRDICT